MKALVAPDHLTAFRCYEEIVAAKKNGGSSFSSARPDLDRVRELLAAPAGARAAISVARLDY